MVTKLRSSSDRVHTLGTGGRLPGDCRRATGIPFDTRSLCTMVKPGPRSRWAGGSQYDFGSTETQFIKLSTLYIHPRRRAAIRPQLTSFALPPRTYLPRVRCNLSRTSIPSSPSFSLDPNLPPSLPRTKRTPPLHSAPNIPPLSIQAEGSCRRTRPQPPPLWKRVRCRDDAGVGCSVGTTPGAGRGRRRRPVWLEEDNDAGSRMGDDDAVCGWRETTRPCVGEGRRPGGRREPTTFGADWAKTLSVIRVGRRCWERV